MKKLMLLSSILLIISFICFSCKGNKQNAGLNEEKNTNSSKCEVTAKVMDFTGLSSCSILLLLKDGSFLNPVQGAPRQELLRAEKIKITYTPLEEAISSCMKGKLVNIDCFTILKKGTPIKGEFN